MFNGSYYENTILKFMSLCVGVCILLSFVIIVNTTLNCEMLDAFPNA
jgi:hypothetical protein